MKSCKIIVFLDLFVIVLYNVCMHNKDFIIIEEYNNVTLSTDLTATLNRFSPQLFVKDFSDFFKNFVESLDTSFFKNNHFTIVATNNMKRLSNAKNEYADCEWHVKKFVSKIYNYMDVHYCLFKNSEGKENLVVLIYLNGYYIRKQALTYGKI